MTVERISNTTTEDHADERYPWVLPENGKHVTTFVLDDMVKAFGVVEDVAATLIYDHHSAVTTYDSDTVMSGCGCGWIAKTNHALDATGRAAAAEDLANHLGEMIARIEFSGTSD